MVTIHRCRTDEVPDVLAWLDRYWKRGHIFTVQRSLFDWQHALRDHSGEYSVAIARRDADNELLGILGYLPTRHFDASLASDNTVWLALWKVRDDVETGGLGLRLVRFVMDTEPHTAIGVLGFNPEVGPIYRALGFSIGELNHYVLPNPDVSHFELASLRPTLHRSIPDDGLTAIAVDDDSFSRLTGTVALADRDSQAPRKTLTYFRARYLHHPIYRYTCLLVRRGTQAVGLLATRTANVGGCRAVRVVDYLGPPEVVGSLGSVVLAQLRSVGAEYADVYNWGLESALFERAGFTHVDADGPDIVPDHFEPFEKRNVRILFALKTEQPAVLYKGDSDQDRPNQLPLT